MSALACSICGAPIQPAAHEVRVRCGHCGATVDVTSENVARLAGVLERAGVRVAPNPMTTDDIHADLARRAAAGEEKRKKAILLAAVLGAVFMIVLAAVLLSVGP